MTELPTPWPDRTETAALRRLREELQDDAAADRFVADFLELLDRRLVEVDRLVGRARTREDAITALLTIETSGRMIGADELVAAATALRLSLSDDGPTVTTELVRRVHTAGESTKRMFGRG